MKHPPLVKRASPLRKQTRRKKIPPRHERIMNRIYEMGVTNESVADRAGYSHATLDYIRSGRTKKDVILSDFEQALDLEPWTGDAA